MDFGKVLDHIGHFGWFQAYVYILSCIPQVFVGIHMLASVFIQGEPKHRCFVDGCDSKPYTQYEETWLNFTIPEDKDVDTGLLIYSQCHVFSRANDSLEACLPDDFNNVSSSCPNFVYATEYFNRTIVTEWDVVCDEKWKLPLANSIFMVGILIGSLVFGHVGDRYGRKLIFTISPPLFLACAVGTAFSSSFTIYVVLRFLTAACASGLFQTAFVVAIEFVGPKYRLWCANFMQIIFAVGELLLAGIAYMLHDWNYLQLAISIPIALLLPYYWLMPESVRWQLSHGQTDCAVVTIQKAIRWNGKEPLPNFLLLDDESTESVKDVKKQRGILDLFKHPLLRRWSINIIFNWFVNALVYYGLSMQAGKLGGSPYVNFVALSAVEIPAVFLSTFALSRCGRRLTLCITLLLGGIACIVPIMLPKSYLWLSTPLAIVGKSNIAASFAVIYVYSAEIFPTVLRNTALGIASTGARIGGIIAPNIGTLAYLGEEVPMIIFGIFSVVAGVLAFDLPETRNKILPEDIDDVIFLKSQRRNSSENLFRKMYNWKKVHNTSRDEIHTPSDSSQSKHSSQSDEGTSLLDDQ